MKTLVSKRLVLTKFNKDDAFAAFNAYMNDKRVTEYLTWEPHQSVEVSINYIDNVIRNYVNPNYYNWAIRLKENGQIIGAVSVVRCDESLKTIEIGYVLAYDYWNQGYMSEVLIIIIAYFFSETTYETIKACHDKRNVASGRVMQKAKMYYLNTERRKEKQEIALDHYQITKRDYLEQNQKHENLIIETLLRNRSGLKKIAFAESCTGGALVNRLIACPNASYLISESYVTYQDEAKINVLGVDPILISNYSAVSIEVAKAMVQGLYKKTKADICLSVTGFTDNISDSTLRGVAYVACLIKKNEKIFVLPPINDLTMTRKQIIEKQVDQILAFLWNEVAVLKPSFK